MRMPAPRTSDTSLRLFGAALSLAAFGTRELAQHAQVKANAARAFVEDNCKAGLIERMPGSPVHRDEHGGRPRNLYRVRAERRDEILRLLAEIRRGPAEGTMATFPPDMAGGDPEDYSPLALLESSLAALAKGEFDQAEERQELLDQADIRIRGAEADLRAMGANCADLREIERHAVRLGAARQALAAARTPSIALPASAAPAVADVFLRFLRDWTIPVEVPEPEDRCTRDQLAAYDPGQVLDVVLHAAGTRPGSARSIFEPALLLLQAQAGWTRDTSVAVAAQVCARVLEASPSADAFGLAALAVIAAALEVRQAAEPLLTALLSSDLLDRIGAERRTCLMAIAHLARPSRAARDQLTLTAASVCQYLLARRASAADELDILAPAALQAPHVGSGDLLHRVGSAMFNRGGMKSEWRRHANEGALVRNLVLALQGMGFALLQDHMPGLLEESYGRGLLLRMSAPEHEALDLTDANGSPDFIIRVGRRVAAHLGVNQPLPVPLILDKKAADRLSDLLTSRTWASRAQTGDRLQSTFSSRLVRRGATAMTAEA
jgi:hypothetical protein